MPPVSEAQRRWAWSQKDKNTKEGRTAKEFADADPGGKLPEKKAKPKSKMYGHPSSSKM